MGFEGQRGGCTGNACGRHCRRDGRNSRDRRRTRLRNGRGRRRNGCARRLEAGDLRVHVGDELICGGDEACGRRTAERPSNGLRSRDDLGNAELARDHIGRRQALINALIDRIGIRSDDGALSNISNESGANLTDFGLLCSGAAVEEKAGQEE